VPPQPPARTTDNWLAARTLADGARPALADERGTRLTYAEVLEAAARRAPALRRAAGTGRVALLAANSVEHALWVATALGAGVQTVPLNTRLSAEELAAQLADSRCTALLHDARNAEKAAAAVRAAGGPGACGPRVLSFDEAAGLAADGGGSRRDGLLPFFDLDAVSTVMYTSGSTGRPKGVLQTYGNHWHSAVACRLNLGFSVRDVWGCPTPLFHTSGLSVVMRSLALGTAVRVYGGFDARRVNDDVLDGSVTCLSAVSYQIERMLDDLESRPGDLRYPPTLRFVLQGGGALAPRTLERCRLVGMPVAPSFGMTETASQVVAFAPGEAFDDPGASGRPLAGVRLRVCGPDDDRALPAGTVGRVVLSSPTLCAGYLGQEGRYRASFTPEGWFDTGDLGFVDAKGLLHVTCRLADLIVSGGENVYPAEVEAVLRRHPAVADAAVAGVADDRWGAVPAALCVAREREGRPSDAELTAFCREHLAPYKCPRRVVWCDALPLTANGKVRRAEVARLLAGTGGA
jgi:O-succinylbenzoic acid--CoA ligase